MSVWVEADDESAAWLWGRRILREFVRERFRYCGDEIDPSAFDGDIETDPEILEASEGVGIPVCKTGEIPNWPEPWKNDHASGPHRLVRTDTGST
jgi:hypothetical protein